MGFDGALLFWSLTQDRKGGQLLFAHVPVMVSSMNRGFVAAWVVAELGGTVLLLNRTSQRVSDSMDQLKTIVPEGKFIDVACDLQDFKALNLNQKP